MAAGGKHLVDVACAIHSNRTLVAVWQRTGCFGYVLVAGPGLKCLMAYAIHPFVGASFENGFVANVH